MLNNSFPSKGYFLEEIKSVSMEHYKQSTLANVDISYILKALILETFRLFLTSNLMNGAHHHFILALSVAI